MKMETAWEQAGQTRTPHFDVTTPQSHALLHPHHHVLLPSPQRSCRLKRRNKEQSQLAHSFGAL